MSNATALAHKLQDSGLSQDQSEYIASALDSALQGAVTDRAAIEANIKWLREGAEMLGIGTAALRPSISAASSTEPKVQCERTRLPAIISQTR